MYNRLVVHCISLLILLHNTESNSTNDSDSLLDDAPRVPRVSGRIVKVYSGTRPDPVHCTGEGFQGDPTNCAVFYRCMKSGNGKFTVFRFQCGPGTVYDPDTEVCNHPRSTRRKECGGIVDSSYNDQTHINEIDNAPVEIPSPIVTKQPVYTESDTTSKPINPYLLWSSTSERSTKNYFTRTTRPPYRTSTVAQSYDERTVYPNYPHHPTSQSTQTSRQSSSPNVDICTSDGFMGDSKNCRKFYRCVSDQRGGYTKYEFLCSESTMWDDDIQSCNHPWAVKRSRCGRSSITNDYIVTSVFKSTTDTTSQEQLKTTSQFKHTKKEQTFNNEVSSSSQQQTQISYGSKVTQIQNQISNGPVTQNQTQINYSDLINQTMSYGVKQNQIQKSNESAISQVQTQIIHGEKGMQSQLQIDHSNQSSQMQIQINEISTKLPTTIQYNNNEEETHTTHLNNNNNNKCTESGFMGDDNDCKKFYRCVDNGRKSFTMYEFSCGEGTVWDPKIEACNHAWAVEECGGKVTSEIEGQTTEPSTTKSTQSYYTTPTKSTQNYITSSSTIVLDIDEEINDDSGYGNHIQQHTTTYSTIIKETTQKPSNQEENDCKSSGFIGDANNCKKFYRCVDNGKGSFTKYEFQCGEGTLWDPDIEACNHAWAVKKCGGTGSNNDKVDSTTNSVTMDITSQVINTASTQTTTQTNHQNDEYDKDDNGYNNDEIPQITSSTTKKPHNQDTTDNTCISSGFMGDNNVCKKFYRCVDNGDGTYIRYEFSCGEGTVWDPKIEACNHPWAVEKCGGNGSKPAYNETTESSSTIVYEEIEGGYPTQSDKNTDVPTQSTSTIKSTTAAIYIENNHCKKSGFVGDNKDCKKFYRCVDNGDGTYMRYEFSCGEGTVWDPKIEACNHPWAVEKCGGSGSSPPQNETSSESSSTIGYEEIESGYPTQSDKNTDLPTQSTSTIKSTTSVIDIEYNNCKKSGFMGDNNDCKKFYRCVDNGDGTFVRYEFSCGEGTVWDSKIEACNHAWAVEKCGSVSETTNVNLITSSENPVWSDEEINNGYPSQNDEELDKTTSNSIFDSTTVSSTIGICKNSGFIGDKYDCKKFYRCVDDGKGSFIKYEFKCGEGTAWDQSIESCNHAGLVQNCGISMNQTTPIHYESTTQKLPTTISETVSNGYYPQTTGESSTIGQPQESDVSNICTKEGFFGDKNDCKKFYRCVDNNIGGFIQYNFVCGEGTVWVQYIQACDHATPDQPCGSSISEISIEPSHENDEMYTDTSIMTSTTSSTEVSFGSTPASENPQTSNFFCISEGFFGDSKDCMKFYRCVDNGKESFTKYDFICGEGTFWDQDMQACNHITESKNCTKSQTSSTSLATDSNIGHSTTPIITEQQSSTEKSETSTSSSDDKCISEGFFPNSNDCSKFFRCVTDGKGGYIKYEFSCGEGTVWVQDIQACDYDDNIATCNKQNGSTKPQTTEVYQSSTQASDLLTSTSSESQTPGKQDDEYPENEPISGEKCLSEGFYADYSDCKRFYRCVDDGHGGFTKYDFVCGEGTAWDENIQGCNHISEVKRCQGSIQETNTQSVMQDEEISQTTEGTSTTKKDSSESTDSTATIASNNKCEKEGYFGNTEDCTQFYRCVDNGNGGHTKYEFTCGEGTIWDQDITTCNHPEDVTNPSCKQKEPSSTSSSSSSTSSQSSTSTTESSNLNFNNCSHEQSSKEPVHKNITCYKAGYYGDPNDCKKFYRCVDWDGDGKRFSVYHFECGEGTIWDPALNTCNHEESVYPPRNCSGTQSQNEIITDDTTTSTQEDTTTEKSTSQQPSSTTEQSTTQQTGASEQTITQQSTTSEQTTTEQTSASEQTTIQQSTTSELTTTQQSTSSEQTTTQQSTTSEQTTTQQSTASEQTTTQQTTTSEQPTTQQSTASEQTTMQQATTSEQTTTQETTSSELTTTQQSTASEITTTQQSTTSEQATTQQTTSSEQTTTQQTTSSEQTTTQQTTSNEETTTQQSTTQETTTSGQSTSTQQSTNSEQTTTNELTTQQSTTNENTTEELTSPEQTTEGTTTEQQTIQASTTVSSSTEQSSSTTEQSNEGKTTTEGKQETSTEESSSSKECPDTEDNQYLYVCPTSFRRHPKYCNLFYQCTEDDDNYDNKIAVFTCPNNTIYDESKTQCVAEQKSDKKCDGEIAQRRRFKRLDGNLKEPIVVGKEKQSCQTVGNLPFEKKYECSPAFLKCKKSKSGALRGYVYKCPEGYIYWSISRRCELIGNLSDCKRSNNNWDKRWEIPVEKTNIDSYKYKLIRTNSNNMH